MVTVCFSLSMASTVPRSVTTVASPAFGLAGATAVPLGLAAGAAGLAGAAGAGVACATIGAGGEPAASAATGTSTTISIKLTNLFTLDSSSACLGSPATSPRGALLLRLRALPLLDVALRRLLQILADLRVGLLPQVGERHADGPVRPAEPAAMHQHDARLLRQAEQDVGALVILLEVLREVFPIGVLGPAHEVDLHVVVGAVRVLHHRHADAIEETLESPFDDELAECLVAVRRVQEGEEREEPHLDLLRE